MILLPSNFQVDEMSDDEGADDAWTKFADIESNARLRNEVELFMMQPRCASQPDSSAEIAASKSKPAAPGSTGIKSGAASGGENGAEFAGAGGIEDTGLENESCGPGLILAGRCGRSLPNGRAQAHPDRLPPLVSPLGLRSRSCPSTRPHELDSDGAAKPASLKAPSLPRVETLESAPSETERVLGLSCPAYQANWLRWSDDVLATQGDTPSDRTSSELVAGATAGLGGAEEAAPAFTPTGGPIGGIKFSRGA